MMKNITIAVLGTAVVGLLIYICVLKKPDVKLVPPTEQTQNTQVSVMPKNEVESTTFDVPEFKLRFTKIPGLTIHYMLLNNNKTINFYSEEIVKLAQKDPAFNGCVAGPFSSIQISTIPRSQTDYQGYTQYSIGDGRYLNSTGQQAPCFNPQNATKEGVDAYNAHLKLFSQFIATVRAY